MRQRSEMLFANWSLELTPFFYSMWRNTLALNLCWFSDQKANFTDMSLGKAARSLIRPVRGVLVSSDSVPKRSFAAVAEARALLEHELDTIRTAGTWKAERVITSKQGPQISVQGSRGSELIEENPCAKLNITHWITVDKTCFKYDVKMCRKKVLPDKWTKSVKTVRITHQNKQFLVCINLQVTSKYCTCLKKLLY